MAPTPASGTDRSRLLDAARGLAVMAVVAYHCFSLAVREPRPDGDVGLGWSVLGAGRLGVDLFFVLSGYLLAGSWQTSRRHGGRRLRAGLADYWRRRLLRILPAYWLSLAVLVPLVAPELLHSAGGPARLALLATLQQHLVEGLPGQVNLAYWSLTTEVHFYLLVPALAAALSRMGARALLPVTLAASLGWRVLAPGGLPESWIVGRLDQFVAGMAAAGVVAAVDRVGVSEAGRLVRLLTARWTGWILGGALAGLGLYHGARFSQVAPLPGDDLVHPGAGLLIAGLMIRALCPPVRRLPRALGGALAGVGTISFGLYLWHYPILEYGLGAAGLPRPGAPGLAVVAALMVGVAGAAAAGVASYRLVEAPFLRRRRARAAEVPAGRPPSGDAWSDDARLAPGVQLGRRMTEPVSVDGVVVGAQIPPQMADGAGRTGEAGHQVGDRHRAEVGVVD